MKKKEHKIQNSRFSIDFFEFSFLVEACIPPTPIARSMFWHDVIDKYYHVLTPDERSKLYEWITRNSKFSINNEECAIFDARYNPDNQYRVKTITRDNLVEFHECYKYNDRYYTKTNTSLFEDFIKTIEKI